ncbi:MAG TPA: hypothetical protein VNM15_01615 [Candidatus Binatia bacterium]|nr:hypothetical protein [Candidatus Binatia bacterium]
MLFAASSVWAAVASQFSFTASEGYSDNIFFSKDKEHDFITVFTPKLTLLYAPPGQVVPTLNLDLSTSGEIYARNSDLTNFGKNVWLNGAYTYQYSPRLNLYVSDSLRRLGDTRTGGLAGSFQSGPTSPPTGVPSPPVSTNLNNLISRGDQWSNWVSLHGSYLYRPDMSFTAGYSNQIVSFVDAGGTDVFHTISLRGIYNWRQEHNLHAGYSISISRSRNGDNGVIHNFDFGDDYFTNYNIQLTPTLSLAASTGLSFNTGNRGPRVANNTSITVTKLWETAQLNAGVRKGLTPSFGVAGVSDTTSFFGNFDWRITEKFSANSSLNFSMYDTKDVNFKTFQASVGAQYAFTSWLSAGLAYYHNWVDSGAGATSTDLLSRGAVRSNSAFLFLTTRFDLWPNTGLARSISPSALTPVITTPFPVQSPSKFPLPAAP